MLIYSMLLIVEDHSWYFPRLNGLHRQVVDAPGVETLSLNAVLNGDGNKQVILTCLRTYRSALGMGICNF